MTVVLTAFSPGSCSNATSAALRIPRSEEVTAACASLLEEIRDQPLLHPQIASAMHRKAYTMLGSDDPFLALKDESDRIAREVCRAVQGPALRVP